MKAMIVIFILLTLQNVAKASDTSKEYSECIEEQTQLIIENQDSYTAQEIKAQYEDLKNICK